MTTAVIAIIFLKDTYVFYCELFSVLRELGVLLYVVHLYSATSQLCKLQRSCTTIDTSIFLLPASEFGRTTSPKEVSAKRNRSRSLYPRLQ